MCKVGAGDSGFQRVCTPYPDASDDRPRVEQLVSLVLLNLLIALMGSSYEEAQEHAAGVSGLV